MSIPIAGHLPPVLLKAYSEAAHAEELIAYGRIRLGELHSYRAIEDDGRCDGTEGEARLRVPGDVTSIHLDASSLEVVGTTVEAGHINWSGSFQNPVYVFCAASTRVKWEHLASAFGQSVVEVFDPRRLRAAIVEALEARFLGTERLVHFVDAVRVRYNKGHVGQQPGHSVRLHVGQKPQRFSADCEWRIAVCLSGTRPKAPTALYLDLKNPESFVRRVTGDGCPQSATRVGPMT